MITVLIVSNIVLWVVVLGQGFGLFALYNHFGQRYMTSRDGRLNQGPELGALVRRYSGIDIFGHRVELPNGADMIVVFASTTCSICSKIRADIEAFASIRETPHVVVISEGPEQDVAEWAGSMSNHVGVIADNGHKTAARYGITITPFAIAFDSDGLVRTKGLINTRADVERLATELEQARSKSSDPILV